MRFALRNLIAAIALFLGTAGSAQPLTRVANTTLQMPLFPAVVGLTTTNAFGDLRFSGNPVGMASPAGETNRLFVIEQTGTIHVITNLAAPNKTTFLDLTDRTHFSINGEEGLLGLSFHPGYSSNGWFFVFYTTRTNGSALTRHDRLARFSVSTTNANVADIASEVIFINQRDEAPNHNAGDLNFGPDGYLYVSVGDEGGEADAFDNAQRIDGDFFGGILRLDVDQRAGSLTPNPHSAIGDHYTVPPDNPFIGVSSFNGAAVNPDEVRTEFWAVGLRNPWQFSIDPVTGWMFASDTGDTTREEINFITKGSNYGWPYREGAAPRPGAGTPPAGLVPTDPIHDHAWGTFGTNQGKATVGGLVYRGSQLPEINGSYVFADYITGNFWALDFDGTNVSNYRQLLADVGATSFSLDPRNGDLLFTDIVEDRIKRVVRGTTVLGSELPATLSATGAFSDLASLTPNPGIVPYDLNLAFWSDNSHKLRLFSIPDTNSFMTFSGHGNWQFPSGMIWIKTFEWEMTNGVPGSRRRLETRFLVRNTEGVYGIVYRWNDEQTEAFLLPEQGLEEDFEIHEGGLIRTQTWHYPSRNECLQCHTDAGGLALGFHTSQLNRDYAFGNGTTNFIAALEEAGYFGNTVSNLHVLPALATATNENVSLTYRIRSYLSANCSQCHQPGGTAQGSWDARITNPLSAAGIIDGLLSSPSTNVAARIIATGSLANSEIYQRIITNGVRRMPPAASLMLDTNGIQLVARWITNELPNHQTFAQWQVQEFGSTNAADSAAEDDADTDGAPNFLEFLTGSDPQQAGDGFQIALHRSGNHPRIDFTQRPNVAYQIEWTTNIFPTSPWQLLDVPANAWFISASNRNHSVLDPATNGAARFYRIRVVEP